MSFINKLAKVKNSLIRYSALLNGNSLINVVGYVISDSFKTNKVYKFKIHNFNVCIRSNTNDLKVALASLGDEFKCIVEEYNNKDPKVIVDAGGYIGTSALFFSKVFPNALVFTIEPSSTNYKILKENVEGVKNIIPINAALGPEKGEASLKDRGTGEWGYTIVSDPVDNRNSSDMEKVEVISVTDILSKDQVSKIDILKLDIEGGEYKLLLGKPMWVEHVDTWIVELHDRIVPGCTDAFLSCVDDRLVTQTDGEKLLAISR